MSLLTILIIYCVLILLASLVGGWIPLWIRLTHARMELAVSFVGGAMLGVGVFHMIPHAFHEGGSIDSVVLWLMVGLITMFLVERFFCYHHHPAPGDQPEGEPPITCQHGPAHGREHGDGTGGTGRDSDGHTLTWGGALIGLTLHTLLAGIALAAATQAEWHGGRVAGLAGIGTFLVIFLHKPLDSMTIGTLLAAGGWKPRFRHIINVLFALVIPAGVALFFLGLSSAVVSTTGFVSAALAFSAGTFLCISLSDLLPELHFHRHDRVKLTLALLLGLGIAYAIGFLEQTGHDHHGHQHGAPAVTEQHAPDDAHEHGPDCEHD